MAEGFQKRESDSANLSSRRSIAVSLRNMDPTYLRMHGGLRKNETEMQTSEEQVEHKRIEEGT